ncbi:MAG: hypothetical protein AUJ03_01195 [Deltaproteobacteria bacterium 13_1_40CM_3_71_4]|nr:MAG: hypothetical protein AUJ03_01195 [Deltaproteobacteria bacterium 13_1_40CM_3_71_4]
MIPFYNQRARARQTAAEAAHFLNERFGEQAELIVVDDGSNPGEAVEPTDLPFSLEPVPTTLAWLRDGTDIVIGDRLHPESVCATEVTPVRQLSSVVYTWMVKHLLGLDFPDTQCGYKGYRATVAKDLFGRLDVTSFAFEAEVLMRARKKGCRIRRQPLRLINNEETSVRLSRHAPRMFLDTLRIAWRARRGRYG